MKDQKTKNHRRRYDAEFKSNVLKMISGGRSIPSISQAMGVSEGLLYRWKSQAKKAEQKQSAGETEQVKALRKRVKELEQERDILKKALSIFSRQI